VPRLERVENDQRAVASIRSCGEKQSRECRDF
jgi:hypothetical protein